MSRFILGLHVGHNASAAIGDASGLRFAIQEERLRGEKNYWGFPAQSIRACLDAVGASTADLSRIAVGSTFVLHKYHSRDDVLEGYDAQKTGVGWWRQRVAIPLATRLLRGYGQAPVKEQLAALGLSNVEAVFLDHHRTHAATAYYGLRRNPSEPHLVLTCDGAGDQLSGSVRVWDGSREHVVSTIDDADSLGAIYSMTTHAMGFVPLEHEYKLMGMAPYCSQKHAEEAADIFRAYLDLDDTGLSFKRKIASPLYASLNRILEDISGKRFDAVCAGLQLFTEDLLVRWTKNAVKKTGIKHVVAAGGVFMNVKANKLIGALPEVESFEAYPSCGDETLAMGAFYIDAAQRFGNDAVKPLSDFYLGDDIKDSDAEAALKASGFPFERPADIADAVASLLVRGEPVARCAGRMEFGARALGNRSILADPSNQDVVRVINQMVKKRDFWMPFAPMVMAERQHDYLLNDKKLKSPYMMMTFDSKPNFRDLIAAVHNADLTCRAQILEREQNPAMHDIIRAFDKKTGRGIVLNTSFNLHGFPIVRTPADALHVFRGSGLTHMQVGSFLVHKT